VTKSGSAAAVLDFAVGQILRDDTALGALPAVLERLVSVFGLRAALAFQRSAVLAMHPPDSVDDQLLDILGRPVSELLVTELTPVQITIGGQTIFTGFLRDLTEIERSHAALAEQTERLNCLIASAIPGVLITDEQGTVTNVSKSFGEMFGLAEPHRLAGTSAISVLHRIGPVFADPAGCTRQIAAVVRARQPLTGEQIQAAKAFRVDWPGEHGKTPGPAPSWQARATDRSVPPADPGRRG
jgi:PAS domain-containing protein